MITSVTIGTIATGKIAAMIAGIAGAEGIRIAGGIIGIAIVSGTATTGMTTVEAIAIAIVTTAAVTGKTRQKRWSCT